MNNHNSKKRGQITLFIIAGIILIVIALIITYLVTVERKVEVPPIVEEAIPEEEIPKLFIADFKFCKDIDEEFNCIGETNEFKLGDEVKFRFDVYIYSIESEAKHRIEFYEDIGLIDPLGYTIFEYDPATAYHYDEIVDKPGPYVIPMKDSIITYEYDLAGEYILEVYVNSPIFDIIDTRTEVFKLE